MFHRLPAALLAAGAILLAAALPAQAADPVRHEKAATVAVPGINSFAALGGETWFTSTRNATAGALGGNHQIVGTTPKLGNLTAQLTANTRTRTVFAVNRGVVDKKPSVSVIDAVTRQITATIPVGAGPNGVGVDEDSGLVFVAEGGAAVVSVLDPVQQKVIATVPVGSGPDQVVVHQGRAYVANLDDNTVSVLDTKAHKVIATIPVGANPRGLAVDPVLHRLYAVNQANGTVTTIDTRTAQVFGEPFAAGAGAGRAAVDPATGFLYAAQAELGQVAVLDPVRRKVIGTLEVAAPGSIGVNANTGAVYVADGANIQVFARFAAPVLLTEPAGVEVAAGSAARFSASARGAVSTRWQESIDGGRSWTDLRETGDTLTVTAEIRLSGRQFRAVFTNPTGSTATAAAVLTVPGGQPTTSTTPPPTGTTTPGTTTPPTTTTTPAVAPPPATTQPPTPRLANTGAEPIFPLLTGLALLTAGTALLLFHHRTKKRETA
ncbi:MULTISPECIES: hypothetical protein [unclassified Crossiella]|uniref:hypothetical protein n=1 Tax=unclassified Crossiella TaxID=2620835 RepID=UPI001FFF621B|nr:MULTISPECIES: hypothetical protein [unclassified Crossiella]MCK2237982.1 hypothetical protein [Crossiella sp. S99.2]MCK2255265.1 hypothetical protein [Crossiella sp. S99.1]